MMDPSSISNKNSPLPNSLNMAALTDFQISKYTKLNHLYTKLSKYLIIFESLLITVATLNCLSKKDVTINLPA